jgi:hypothetical protein
LGEIKQWALKFPEQVAEAENEYSRAYKKWWENDGNRFTTYHQIGMRQNMSLPETFELFGDPGQFGNTGWITLPASALASFKLHSGEKPLDEFATQFVKRLAPGLSNNLALLFSEKNEDVWISDLHNWVLERPTEVEACESAYKEAFEKWTQNGGKQAKLFSIVKNKKFENLDELYGTIGQLENSGDTSFIPKLAYEKQQEIILRQNGHSSITKNETYDFPVGFEKECATLQANATMDDYNIWTREFPNEQKLLSINYNKGFQKWYENGGLRITKLQQVNDANLQTRADVFNFFGNPGESANTGWISILATVFSISNGQFRDEEILKKVDLLMSKLAASMKHEISYYSSESGGQHFMEDTKKWALDYPGEVKAVEHEYEKRYIEWKRSAQSTNS